MSFSTADQNEIILKLILQKFELAGVDMEKDIETIERIDDGVPENSFCPNKSTNSFDSKSVSNEVEANNRIIVEAEIHPEPQRNEIYLDNLSESVSPVPENIQIFNIEDIPIVFENNHSETQTLAPVDIEVLDNSLSNSGNNFSSVKLNTSIDQYFIQRKILENIFRTNS